MSTRAGREEKQKENGFGSSNWGNQNRIVGVIAQKPKGIYQNSAEIRKAEAAPAERGNTFEDWQYQRNNKTGARWTRRLIKNLKSWAVREHRKVNFYVI